MVRRLIGATVAVSGLLIVLCATSAHAGDNDVTLQGFGRCANDDVPPCRGVVVDEDGFRSMAQELAVAMTPVGLQPAETTGLNGFAFQLIYNTTSISEDAEYWATADPDGDVGANRGTLQLQLRKGLPYSFEVGANVGMLLGSELVSVGGELKYALHEDTLWPLPDLAIRGWGNAVFGNRDLELFNAGFDVIASLPIGLGGVVQLTPFAGYSFHVAISGSGLLDASPADPRPPVDSPDNPSESNAPEFVFETESFILHRGFVGLRLSLAVVDLSFQGTFGAGQTTLSVGAGASF